MARNCLVVDLNRCIGCYGCEVACKQENNITVGEYWNKVIEIGPFGELPHIQKYWLPTMCQQCEGSPCVQVCPTGASFPAILISRVARPVYQLSSSQNSKEYFT